MNNLKIAVRNLKRQPFFSGLNIAGLAVGLSACWLIGTYVLHENSFDRFLPEVDRICAVGLDLKMGDNEGLTTNTPPPLGLRLAADFPEIELAARTFYLQETVVRRDQAGQAPLVFNERTAYAADTSFLELFGFPMKEGGAATALDRPGSLVLSEKAADKYFGKSSAIGQQLYLNDRAFTVTGIARNLPTNSSIQFDFVVPSADFKVVDRFSWSWIWLQMDTWVRLRQAATPHAVAALEAKFPAMVRTHAPSAFERVGQNFDEQLQKGDRYNVKLFPLSTLHLKGAQLTSRLSTLGDATQVKIYGAAGLLILLLACVNFMNLSTARSAQRAREVGMRKVLGSQRSALISQFLAESMFFSATAMVLAIGMAAIALPWFNDLTGLQMHFTDLFSAKILGLGLALTFITGLVGGSYPAFFLSGFKLSDIFKAAGGSGKAGHGSLRNGLVVFQFAVSAVLMLGAWTVYRQLEFARNQSPGLQRENVMVFPLLRSFDEPAKIETFRQQIAHLPEVSAVSHSQFLPSIGSFGDFYEPEQGDQSRSVTPNLLLSSFLADADFVNTLGLEILEGRNFLPENSKIDSTSVILNEAAVKAIGWDNPIGKWMRYPGNQNQRFQVVGVMRNFHLGSIKTAIEPAAIFHESSKSYRTWASFISVRLKPGMTQTGVEKTEALWKASVPTAPFDYDFLDESFARLYRSEAQAVSVLGIFTGLALFIGCLGLFGLAAYMAERRTKEIGIRKVLGATVGSLTAMLAKDFLKLVLLAVVVATPIAWYATQHWLANFAYRINVQWWMFLVTGVLAAGIALLTVGFQSIKAALANPVDSLHKL